MRFSKYHTMICSIYDISLTRPSSPIKRQIGIQRVQNSKPVVHGAMGSSQKKLKVSVVVPPALTLSATSVSK